jgi:hypothetical protein
MSPKEAPGKKQVAVMISEEVVERAKNLVYWTPGATLAGLVEQGLIVVVERAERRNKGRFSRRPSALKRGRPISPRK